MNLIVLSLLCLFGVIEGHSRLENRFGSQAGSQHRSREAKYLPQLRSIRPRGFRERYSFGKWYSDFLKENREICGLSKGEITFADSGYGFRDVPPLSWPWMVSLYRLPHFLTQIFQLYPNQTVVDEKLKESMKSISQGHLCGATLVSSEFVLTAAHCVLFRPLVPTVHLDELYNDLMLECKLAGPEVMQRCEQGFSEIIKPQNVTIGIPMNDTDLWELYVGTHQTPPENSQVKHVKVTRVKKIIHYPDSATLSLLKDNLNNGDLALLHLEQKIDSYTDNIRPICLTEKLPPVERQEPQCAVAGWGVLPGPNKAQLKSPMLKHARYNILSDKRCYNEPLSYNKFSKICALEHHPPLKQTGSKTKVCDGDSGGPLICKYSDNRWYQIGITSYGQEEECEVPDAPDVFTRVPRFATWILQTMWNMTRS